MTSPRKIASLVTCVALICGAAILWPTYKEKATERKLAEAARVRAEHGDANAQFSLGGMYRKGQGVPQDHAEAVRWYRKAADQGDPRGQYDLGLSYFQGQGVPRDHAEAVRWYRKAADQGDAMAQYGLGFMYAQGKGVPQDHAEAVRWYRKAADHGDATAQYALGVMYAQGKGVPQDYAEAISWYRKAAEQGDANAQYVLGFMYYRGQGVPQDHAEAVRWYRKAGYQGDKTAQGILTVIYFKGQGAPKDYTEAIRWFGKVAASCFARTQGPLARWPSIAVILLALPLLVVPQRRWGRATWLPWALSSALFAAMLTHELLLSESFFALLARGPLGTIFGGFGRVLWLALLAGGSAICAFVAILGAARGLKRGDQDQLLTP